MHASTPSPIVRASSTVHIRTLSGVSGLERLPSITNNLGSAKGGPPLWGCKTPWPIGGRGLTFTPLAALRAAHTQPQRLNSFCRSTGNRLASTLPQSTKDCKAPDKRKESTTAFVNGPPNPLGLWSAAARNHPCATPNWLACSSGISQLQRHRGKPRPASRKGLSMQTPDHHDLLAGICSKGMHKLAGRCDW